MKKYFKIITIILVLFLSITKVNATTVNCNYTLRVGSNNNEVKNLQILLNKTTNCNIDEDGIFGNLTKQCVIKFQKQNNLDADGIVGPLTCKKINSYDTNTNNNNNNNTSNTTYSTTATIKGSVVNVRKGPSTSYGIVTSLSRGTKVTILEKSNNWYKVKLSNNKTGYIRSDLLTLSNNTVSNTNNTNNILGTNMGIVIGSNVNIRRGPSTSYGVLTTASIGTRVTIINQTNNWYQIKLPNNKTGYIRSDLLSKYLIIVDLSDQRLYYSSNGNMIMNVPVVTGTKGKTDTPTGNYVLRSYNKQYDTTLRGSYGSAHVYYWMPFIGNSIGFHDAAWRSTSDFNNNSTYTYNGSHGCVNMLSYDAQTLYSSLNNDTAVLVRN